MLHGMGIADEFSALIIGAECQRAKPFPDPYLAGLQALGIEAHEAIAIEDSPSGARLPFCKNDGQAEGTFSNLELACPLHLVIIFFVAPYFLSDLIDFRSCRHEGSSCSWNSNLWHPEWPEPCGTPRSWGNMSY